MFRVSVCVAFALSTLPVCSASVRFAVVGDYGANTTAELNVSNLIKSWNPDFVVTTGDNNYETGSATTIDANIGKYYHEFIYNYQGAYGAGSATQRFIPCLGNHDWGNVANNPTGANPFLAYFTLPGNERYFNWRNGPVEFFVLDSDTNEASGVTSGSTQATWCRNAMAASTAPWKIPVFHHPPYSSGQHGSTTYMRWPFESWGASTVLCGHDHTYERCEVGGIPYFVNGLGGKSIYSFVNVVPESRRRFNSDYGAMLVNADDRRMTLQFITRAGLIIETIRLYYNGQPYRPIRP